MNEWVLACSCLGLTLDPKNAKPKLILSEENKRATHGDQQSYPDDPERFDSYHQVLCKEALTGRHYWEVKCSVGYEKGVAVGLTYSRTVPERRTQSELPGVQWHVLDFGPAVVPQRSTKVNLCGYVVSGSGSACRDFVPLQGEDLSHVFTFRAKLSASHIRCKKNMAFIHFSWMFSEIFGLWESIKVETFNSGTIPAVIKSTQHPTKPLT